MTALSQAPRSKLFGWATLVLLVWSTPNAARPPSPERDPLTRLRKVYLDDAAQYRFFRDASEATELILQREPVMSWTGTEGWSGDIFVWTHGGRPCVIGGFGSWPDAGRRRVIHEFQSLAADPLPPVSIGDSVVWSPSEGSVELTPLQGGPTPATSARLRLVQMRRLTEEFEPHMLGQAGDETLRLLPQPLYRYQEPSGDLIDGALFGYVFSTTGTDVDFLLLLECRRTDGVASWYYTPARFTHREVWLTHDDREAWRADFAGDPASGVVKQPYLTVVVRSIDEP